MPCYTANLSLILYLPPFSGLNFIKYPYHWFSVPSGYSAIHDHIHSIYCIEACTTLCVVAIIKEHSYMELLEFS